MNTLFYGDNLEVLRKNVADASVDLVYLDPPFQSGKDYNLIFESHHGERGPDRAQTAAFKDTWRWGPEAEELFVEVENAGGKPATALRALRSMLHESDLMAYLCMMAPRLVELRRVLKTTGSLYLHCERWQLWFLIEVADEVGLLTGTTKKMTHDVLRDFRNMIHPIVQIRDKLEPSEVAAEGSRLYVHSLVDDVRKAPP